MWLQSCWPWLKVCGQGRNQRWRWCQPLCVCWWEEQWNRVGGVQRCPAEVGWWRSGRLRGWGSQTGRGRWSRWWDCSVTMSQSANRPCLTGRGQPLTAPNYTSSVLQKAANVACPFKNTSWPQPHSDGSDVYGGIWPTYSSTAVPFASFLSFKVLRDGVKPGRGLDI